jgi:hypothetical protein
VRAVQRRFGRTPAQAELQAPAGDQVGRRRLLGHVERVLVAHVDNGGPDLDPLGARPNRRQQRERGRQLRREVVHAHVRAVDPDLLGGLRQFDRLVERVGRGPRLRAGSVLPVAEAQETDALPHLVDPRRPTAGASPPPGEHKR